MRKITQKELDKKVELHQEWLKNKDKGERLVLIEYNLSDLSLVGVDLRHANLMLSNLNHTDLRYSNLASSILVDTDLNYANLNNADLTNALLSESNLNYTDLTGANLYNAILNDCSLENTCLSQANTNQIQGVDVYSIDNIGTFHGKVTYVPSIDTVYAGCWTGTLEQFLEKGLEMNGVKKDNKREIENIKLAYQFFKNNSK